MEENGLGGGVSMKIVCEKCESSFKAQAIEGMDCCPVCGEPFGLDGDTNTASDIKKEKTKWYYYKEGGGMLDNTLSSSFTPLYTFEAIDLEDAKEQLKEVLPNSPLFNMNSTPKTQCPYCFSTEIQLVPKKFSLLTGFATNSYNRVCIRCQRKF